MTRQERVQWQRTFQALREVTRLPQTAAARCYVLGVLDAVFEELAEDPKPYAHPDRFEFVRQAMAEPGYARGPTGSESSPS